MANDDNYTYYSYYYDDEQRIASVSTILFLLFGAMLSFYYQALVTEERFVPALNVIAKRFNMSNDVAGATLMAAGASAPELFAALVSTFITRSALGLGTVVGSLIFNQLAISAGAIFASKNNVLLLDPHIFIRDVTFYGISILLFAFALRNRGEVDYDDVDHMFISKLDSCLFLLCYFIYVVICANYDWILRFLKLDSKQDEDDEFQQCNYEAFEGEGGGLQKHVSLSKISTMPFVRSCGGQEPSGNFHKPSSERAEIPDTLTAADSIVTELYEAESSSRSFSCGSGGGRKGVFLLDQIAPSTVAIHGIDEIERDEDGTLRLHLWQRSAFYDMAKIDMNAWRLRWVTFAHDGISSVADSLNSTAGDSGVSHFPYYKSFEVDEARLLINVKTQRRDYMLLAPSEEIFLAAVARFEEGFDIPKNLKAEEGDVAKEAHSSLIDLPSEASFSQTIIHIISIPTKLFVHLTIPDVRNGSSISLTAKAFAAASASILSLIAGSFLMVETLERLAKIFDIPESVVGATISAAGSSLPPYVSSSIAASLGLGNMAISNVFGSNTFNVLIGLGVPWALYTIIYGEDYSDLSVEGVDDSLTMMVGSLILYIGIVLCSRFRLRLWHAILFDTLYLGYVVYIVATCF